jgi:hypothetical protein
MSNEHEEKVAGVTLYFQHASFQKPHATEKYRVELKLDCEVHDEALWQVVQAKFAAGFRVFTSEDFHIEVIDVMRQELRDAQTKLARTEVELARREDELRKYKEPLAAFGQALRGGQ